MKKYLLAMLALVGFSFASNAQIVVKTEEQPKERTIVDFNKKQVVKTTTTTQPVRTVSRTTTTAPVRTVTRSTTSSKVEPVVDMNNKKVYKKKKHKKYKKYNHGQRVRAVARDKR